MTSHFHNGAHICIFEILLTLARYTGSGLVILRKNWRFLFRAFQSPQNTQYL